MKELSKIISKTLGVALPLITILAVLTPFIMVETLFFPFITGKAFYFRILVEVMALLYILYMFVDKSVRPRLSPIAIAVSVFTLALGIATIFAEDPLKSFWSNYERMEGYILFIHLFAYFFIAGAVLKLKEGWWKWFFISSLVMSVIVGSQALIDFYSDPNNTGYRIFGHLGNSSYLGVYSLIHFFIALFLIIQKVSKKSVDALNHEGAWVSISFYTLIAIFNIVIMFNTGTRGSFVGLVGGVFVAALLIALFERKNKVLKTTGISLIIVSVLFVLCLGLGRNTSFVKNSDMLTRFSELVTLDVKGVLGNQGKARSLLWGIAWDGFKDRPVVGWGLDNFHYVFAAHYNPEMANQEQWFDRSHNVFTDWLTQAGLLGLVSYLALFGSALYIVWRRKEDGMSYSEKAVITGGFVAYLGHNLFVFDNLSSYVMFFSILAFLHQYTIYGKVAHAQDEKTRYQVTGGALFTAVAILSVVGFIYVIYTVNMKPLFANTALIGSLRTQASDPKTKQVVAVPIKERFESLQKSIAYNSMTNSEQYEQLNDRGVEFLSSNATAEEKQKAYEYIIEKYESAIKRTPNDPRIFFFYALYLSRLDMVKEAQAMATRMLELSPEKPSFLTFAAINELKLGNKEKFIEYAKKAYSLNPQDEQAYALNIMGLIQSGNPEAAEALATSTADKSKYLTNWSIVNSYLDVKMSARVIGMLKSQIVADPYTLDLRSSLASVYVKVGNPQAGIKELQEIIKIAPQYKTTVEQAINQIKAEAKIK